MDGLGTVGLLVGLGLVRLLGVEVVLLEGGIVWIGGKKRGGSTIVKKRLGCRGAIIDNWSCVGHVCCVIYGTVLVSGQYWTGSLHNVWGCFEELRFVAVVRVVSAFVIFSTLIVLLLSFLLFQCWY